jgi:hypothetical protein
VPLQPIPFAPASSTLFDERLTLSVFFFPWRKKIRLGTFINSKAKYFKRVLLFFIVFWLLFKGIKNP